MRTRLRTPKRATRKRPRPAPMYLIARGPKPHRIASAHEDESPDWELTIAPLGSPPTSVPARPANIRKEVREWLAADSQSFREADARGEPLTPFPPKAPPRPPKKWLASTGPGARFEALRRRPGAEKIAALERDQEMKDWHLNEVYQEIASFHVPPVFYSHRRFPDGTMRARSPLRPRPPAMPAAALRWIHQWRRDLRAALKETGAPIDRVPTDRGRTVDYTLTKWGLDNIRQAPLWRRDEAILRRTKAEAAEAEVLASDRPGRTGSEGFKRWVDEMSRHARAAKIRLNRKRGAKKGVKGIKRNYRKSGLLIGPEVEKIHSRMERDKVFPEVPEKDPEDILENAGVAPTWGRNRRSVGHLKPGTVARILFAVHKNLELKTADLATLRRQAERIRSKNNREGFEKSRARL